MTLALGLLAAGAVAGLLAGLLGVGGGIVIVPALYALFSLLELDVSIRMPLAVGTSLATIVFTATSSTLAHRRRQSVEVSLLRSFLPWLILGVGLGSLVVNFAATGAMLLIFATIAILVAIYMAFVPQGVTLARGLPRGPVRWLVATFIGAVSSIMGIGGGTLSVPTFTLAGYPVRLAVGTGAAIGFIISVPATISMILLGWGNPHLPVGSLGFVNLLGFIIIVPMTMLTAPLGARLAHRIPPLMLRRAFALFLAITGARMYFEWAGLA